MIFIQVKRLNALWVEKDTVVLLRSGIGKVNAAMSTAVLLQHFKPDCIINTGSAGGFDPALNVGDVVISTEVRHHDGTADAADRHRRREGGFP